RSRSDSGLGLGLAIAKNLVELHGGSVMAKSAGEGKGSTFIVLLPISVIRSPEGENGDEHRVSAVEAEFATSPDLKGVRVMVVDDNPDAMNLVKHLLEQCGVSVAGCASGEECVSRLPAWHPGGLVSE